MTGTDEADRQRVRELLGREPQGRFEVVVRDSHGDPVVLRNDPLLDDGTPMPTRYWLVGPDEMRRVAHLEAAGGVDQAEREVDPDELDAAHARYGAERDAALPIDHTGPRPSGGVGGTRTGVKCLHAHWAWHLAGGDDPVGRWIAEQLAATPPVAAPDPTPAIDRGAARLGIGDDETVLNLADAAPFAVPWGPSNLTARWLADHDPPHPADLTNALGAIDDYLDDVERLHPGFADVADLTVTGASAVALARLELGHGDHPPVVEIRRSDAEDVFRLITAETSVERRDNPGLPPEHADTIVAALCIVLAVARRLRLESITLDVAHPPPTI